jgi:hypothetical protein
MQVLVLFRVEWNWSRPGTGMGKHSGVLGSKQQPGISASGVRLEKQINSCYSTRELDWSRPGTGMGKHSGVLGSKQQPSISASGVKLEKQNKQLLFYSGTGPAPAQGWGSTPGCWDPSSSRVSAPLASG